MRHLIYSLVRPRDLLQLTPIRMENYGNSAVKVLGMFHAFLRWKGQGLQTNYSMSQTVINPLICYPVMLVTHLEFSSLVTLWKNSFELEKPPEILLSHMSDTHPCIKE